MEATIHRREAWAIIQSGDHFSIGFVTADRRRGTGGQYITVKNWQKVNKLKGGQEAHDSTPKPSTLNPKDPNHSQNKTFNIHNPNNKGVHIHKVHYRLFDRFNGKTVTG